MTNNYLKTSKKLSTLKINKFWDNDLKQYAKLIELHYINVSNKYNLLYRDYPIYIKLDKPEDHKNIIGDCYKQVLHLSSNNSYYGIMRPEFTYMAAKDINLNSQNLYYIGDCYRNETQQFLRYQNFVQLGCEFFATTMEKGVVTLAIMLAHLKEIMHTTRYNNKVKYIFCANSDNEFLVNLAKDLFADYEIEINDLKRVGGIGGKEHSYTYFCFEIHAYHVDKPQQLHEIIGGGSYNIDYKKNIIYSCGYAIGLERFMHYILKDQTDKERQDLKTYIINYILNLNTDTKTLYIDINNKEQIRTKLAEIINMNYYLEYKLVKKHNN